jgi:hypothetical protein
LHIRPFLACVVGALALAAATPAEARYRLGIGEQRPEMFSAPAWQDLRLRQVRYVVPWDWNRPDWRPQVDAFMTSAGLNRQDVLVAFTAPLGCYDGIRYSRAPACRAPSARAYRASVRAFDNAYPWVRTYSAWNEVNHVSQPTFRSPRLAVRYYAVLRRMARLRHFRVLAADVLDTTNMRAYLRAFLRQAPGRPRLWGLHNYQDVNRRTSADTRDMLRIVPGRVWLTETGGLVRFGDSRQFQYSESRAARRTRWMFRLAGRFDQRRRGLRATIARLYVYRWYGEPPGARFDAGLVNPDGSPRRAYSVVAEHARSHR